MSKKMLTKILIGALLTGICAPIFLYGGIPLQVLIAIFAFLSSYEIAGLRDESKPNWPMTILITAVVWIMGNLGQQNFNVFSGVWLIILFLIMLVDESMTSDQVVYTFSMSLVVAFAISGVLLIYDCGMKGAGALYVAIACYTCDTGAYFFGNFFGKHKMIPRVSPNKTWEGAIGGYLCGVICSGLFGFFLAKSIPNDLVIAASLILPAVAEIGDLSFSAIKRRWGMKDFGSLFPEHGGVLDRIDSLLFCLMVFNFLMILWGIGA